MAISCKQFLTPKDFNLIIKTSEVVQYDGPAFSCVSLPGSPTLNNVLSALESKVCNIQNTQLQNIVTSQITDYDGTTAFGCFSLTGNAPINDIIAELATQICVNTTAIGALDCTDIEVSAIYTAVNYTPASAHLCGHLSGIDSELATFLTSVPSCLGNNLFTDGNNGLFETGITNMASADFTLVNSVIQAYQGAKSLKATMGAATTNSRIHGTTVVSFTAGETYVLSGYVYAPSANSTGGATKMLAWDGASEFTELTPVDTVDTSVGANQDVWVRIQTTVQPSTNKTLTVGVKAEGLSNTDKIFIDQLEVRCGSQNLVTEDELIDRFKRLVCSWTIEGGVVTTSPVSLDVDIDASLYEVSGAFVTVPDTATTTSITLAATSDNYLDVDQLGNYLVTSVAIAASEPAVAANRMRLFKVTTDGAGVPGAAVDRQNIYPFCNGAAFGNQIIETRHIKDLNVTGAKLENIVGGASVDIANITVDNKGRITAASSYFNLTAPALDEILQYDGANWVNVAILGTILPNANDNETLRYDTGATVWQGSGYLINTGSAIGINLTTPQVALNLAKNLEFVINMAEATGVGSVLAAGGTLTPTVTYYYVVTALDDGSGETVVSAETSKTADAVNKTIDVSWAGVTGADTYRVYKGVATGTYTEYFTVTDPVVTYSDTGAAGTGGSPPAVTTAYVVSLGSSYFLDQIGVGTTAPNASALLDMISITQGFGLPAMTTAQRTAIGTPRTGLVVYNTTTNGIEFYNGAAWTKTISGAGTTNTIPMFSAAAIIANSNLSQDSGTGHIEIAAGKAFRDATLTANVLYLNNAGSITLSLDALNYKNSYIEFCDHSIELIAGTSDGAATTLWLQAMQQDGTVVNSVNIHSDEGTPANSNTSYINETLHKFRIGANPIMEIMSDGLIIYNTSAPSLLADASKIYSADVAGAGTASPHFLTEDNDIIKLFKGAALAGALSTITHTAPGTPDYAIQDLVQPAGYGFVTKDEGNTVLSIIVNLVARVDELEARLQAHGLLT